MFKDEYGIALKQWVAAQKRIEASEERIRATFLDWFFRRGSEDNTPSRPCINVTPPKQPPKK